MFRAAMSFNQDISQWNMSSAIDVVSLSSFSITIVMIVAVKKTEYDQESNKLSSSILLF